MIAQIIKSRKVRKEMDDVVREHILQTCARVKSKATSMTLKLQNGGGEALIDALRPQKK